MSAQRDCIIPGAYNIEEDTPKLISKELQRLLYPLNIVKGLFCPIYKIKDDKLVPNGAKILALYVFLYIVIIILWIVRMIRRYYNLVVILDTTTYRGMFVDALVRVNFMICIIGFAFNINSLTKQKCNNVNLIWFIQKALNLIKIDKTVFKKIIIWNWLYITFFCTHYCIFTLWCRFSTFNFITTVTDIPLLSFDLNIIYAIRIIVLIKHIVLQWRQVLKNNQLIVDDEFNKKIYEAYCILKRALETYEKTFQDIILYYVLGTFFLSLFHIQSCASHYGINHFYFFAEKVLRYALQCTLLRLTLITTLSVEAERLIILFENIQADLTEYLVHKDITVCDKRLYKNLRRLNKASRISVRGIFYLEADLPINLITVLTTYTFLILQLII